MTNSRTATARELEVAAAAVDVAIRGGLISHVERALFVEAAALNPRGFLAVLEKRSPAPSVEVQFVEAARGIVAESNGATTFTSAVLEVGRRYPTLLAAYAREHHGPRSAS